MGRQLLFWLEQKDARLAQEASAEAARRKSIEKELEWVRQGAKGRQSKARPVWPASKS